MNRNFLKAVLTVLLVIISAFSFAACQNNGAKNDGGNSPEGNITGEGLVMPDKTKRKIVYTVYAVLETKDFEKTVQDLDNSLTAINAKAKSDNPEKKSSYIESSNANYNDNSRTMTIVYKINSEYLVEFINGFENFGEMRSRNVTSEDITEKYSDVSALLKTYENEYALYESMLETESNYNARQQYISRMTELSGIINKYQSQLNAYDEIVEFSSVTLNIYGVGKAPKAELYGTKLARVFYGSLNALLEFFKFLLLAAVAVAPFAAIGTGVYFAVRPLIKKRRAKLERLREQMRRDRESNNKRG